MAEIMDVHFIVNDCEFSTQIEERTLLSLRTDTNFADRYVRQIIATGVFASFGIAADSLLETIQVLVGTPQEYKLELQQAVSSSPPQTTVSKEKTLAAQPGKEFNWSFVATKLLIETRFELDTKFEDKKIRQNLLWEEVSSKMLEIGGYTVSGNTCNTKWNNILKSFRFNLDKVHTSGESAVRWEHFHQMQEFFGKKSSSEPAEGQLQASMLLDKPAVKLPTAGPSGNSTAATRPQGNKRKSSDEPPAWFLTYVKQKKTEDMEREERLMVEQRRIQAIEEEKVQMLREYLNGLKKD